MDRLPMLMTLLSILLLLSSQPGGSEDSEREKICLPSNALPELRFLDPNPLNGKNPYPVTEIAGVSYTSMALELQCCATAFMNISWFFDGVPISKAELEAQYEENFQILRLSSRKLGKHIISCIATGFDGKNVTHHTIVTANEQSSYFDDPAFISFPLDQCVEKGSNLSLVCSADIGKHRHTLELDKVIEVGLEDKGPNLYERADVRIIQPFNQNHPSARPVNGGYTEVTIVFTNISAELLNKTYHCSLPVVPGKRVTFSLIPGPCNETGYKTRSSHIYMDGEISVLVSLSLLVVIMVSSVGLILGIRYRKEIKMICKIHGLKPHFRPEAGHLYDIYMMYSDLDNHVTLSIINEIQRHYRICLPDRDFDAGKVIPEQVAEKIQQSRCMLIVITNDTCITEDWFELSICFALQINMKLIQVRAGICSENQKIVTNPDIAAALKVGISLDYPLQEEYRNCEIFFNTLYNKLPSATVL